MVPLLQQLYTASARAPSQLYMLLIVILILSQDAVLARNLHQVTVPAAPWFKERLLQNTSLGGRPCCCMPWPPPIALHRSLLSTSGFAAKLPPFVPCAVMTLSCLVR